jgi:5-deoxy-glucuronate isomerase
VDQLLVRPTKPDVDGGIIHVTPRSAGWRYVGFDVHDLAPGQTLRQETEDTEVLLVFISGRAAVEAGDRDFRTVGGRTTPFEGAPWSVYVPARSSLTVTAAGPVELAICRAPAKGGLPPRAIPPDRIGELTRGTGTNARRVRNILPETEPAESLLVVECVTPGGHWSSYPPHKHDTDRLPAESYLEETYYYRLDPPQGYALQRVYTDDRSLDVAMAAYDRAVVLVPRGYHPVAAPHGFTLYYLNVMAGPKRVWRFSNEPSHEFLLKE